MALGDKTHSIMTFFHLFGEKASLVFQRKRNPGDLADAFISSDPGSTIIGLHCNCRHLVTGQPAPAETIFELVIFNFNGSFFCTKPHNSVKAGGSAGKLIVRQAFLSGEQCPFTAIQITHSFFRPKPEPSFRIRDHRRHIP
jgi:hypothetical protein